MDVVAEITKLYEQGHSQVKVSFNDGTNKSYRLFKSGEDVCYFGKGRRRYGQRVRWLAIDNDVVSVRPARTKAPLSQREKYLDNLTKFKKAFTSKVHPNLWGNLQNGYGKFDIQEFGNLLSDNLVDSYGGYKILCDYVKEKGLDVNKENHYKTTTIKSHKPTWKNRGNGIGQFNECVANIKKHLDNKEDFHYFWTAGYDVTVEGHMSKDGFYRAWFSLEFRGCGNGHYYALINENTAVFLEND